jgi:hypothetical protein
MSVGREVLKWLQGLQLSSECKNLRREAANGYLVANIFWRFYPRDLDMHVFDQGDALDKRLANWLLLNRVCLFCITSNILSERRSLQFFEKVKVALPKDLIDGTIHSQPGSAEALIEFIYTLLTSKPLVQYSVGAGSFPHSLFTQSPQECTEHHPGAGQHRTRPALHTRHDLNCARLMLGSRVPSH